MTTPGFRPNRQHAREWEVLTIDPKSFAVVETLHSADLTDVDQLRDHYTATNADPEALTELDVIASRLRADRPLTPVDLAAFHRLLSAVDQ